MAEEVGVKLNLDSDDFVGGVEKAIGSLSDLSKADLTSLVESFKGAAVELGIMAVAVYAVKKGLEFAEEEDAIKRVGQQFEVLTAQANISSQALIDGLTRSSGGLIDNTQLMKLANEQIIKMGTSAKHLPEIMDLARKAALVMGGTVEEKFSSISNAIAFGNARMLKHAGIIIDQKKAYETYAESIGVTVGMLDQHGRSQAMLNAALAKGREAFAGINVDQDNVTTSLKKTKVAIDEIYETFLMVFDKAFGPVLKKTANSFFEFAHSISNTMKSLFGEGKEKAVADLEIVDKRIETLKAKLKKEEDFHAKFGMYMNPGELATINAELDALEKKKAKVTGGGSEQSDMRKAFAGGDKDKEEPGIDYEKKKQEEAKFNMEMAKMDKDLWAAKQANATSFAEVDKIHEQQKVAEYKEHTARIMEIENSKDLTMSQKRQKIDNENKIFAEKAKGYDDDLKKKRLASIDTYEKREVKAGHSITAAMSADSKRAHANLVDMQKTGHTVFNAIGHNATNAFKAMGDGSQSASEAMKGFAFGAIGDIATSQGELMLLEGIWPPNPVAIAGGGALIALGSALKSQAGSGGSSASSYSGGGGSPADANPALANNDSGMQTVTPTEKKTVTVQIQGHVFDSQESGLRIAEIIKQNADATDFNYKPIGTA